MVVGGLTMVFQEQPNWKRIGTIVIAGIFITAGPAILSSFLGS